MGGTVRHAAVAGLGSVLPERVVPNSFFESLVDTSDEWIRERTGIRERRFVSDGQATSDLATDAARSALSSAGMSGFLASAAAAARARPRRLKGPPERGRPEPRAELALAKVLGVSKITSL